MILTKIRNNLSIAAVLAACILGAYAFILNMKYEHQVTQTQLVLDRNETLDNANKNQASVITGLIAQRIIDEELVASLDKQRAIFENQTMGIRNQLTELEQNDKKIQELLSIELPTDIIGLLELGAANNYRYTEGDTIPASKPQASLPDTKAE